MNMIELKAWGKGKEDGRGKKRTNWQRVKRREAGKDRRDDVKIEGGWEREREGGCELGRKGVRGKEGMNELNDERTDWQIDGWMHEWMDGRTDGRRIDDGGADEQIYDWLLRRWLEITRD